MTHDGPESGPDGGVSGEDGPADVAATAQCPHCGAAVTLSLDPGGGRVQEYVEDCEVCCRPWRVTVIYDDTGRADVAIAPLDA